MNSIQPNNKRYRAVPASRLSRLGSMGSIATGLLGGMITEGARQLSEGKRPAKRDLLLTPANARRVTEQLSKLRGAAMKVGQLLSMEAGEFLPAELTDILSRLRNAAEPMPSSQLTAALEAAWGPGWDTHFQQFSFEPFAAASIGQVHRARTSTGQQLAIKVQYPGISQSIDSDVDNVAALLKWSGLLPKDIPISPLLTEAKNQLRAEADYLLEKTWLDSYRNILAPSDSSSGAFIVPRSNTELTTRKTLAMSYENGKPLDQMTGESEGIRNRAVARLFSLFFRELFEFRMVQTDANFANFLFREDTAQIVLLDFGATRPFSEPFAEAYRALMLSASSQDRNGIEAAILEIGFFQDQILPTQRKAVVELFQQACEPLAFDGEYDFAGHKLATRISESGMQLSMRENYWHTPPPDALFLHRKLGGLYLLATQLKACINVRRIFIDTMASIDTEHPQEN